LRDSIFDRWYVSRVKECEVWFDRGGKEVCLPLVVETKKG
jgi:hypothetical protein